MQDLLILEDVIPSLPLTIECVGCYFMKNKKYKIFVSTKENHLLCYTFDKIKTGSNIKLEQTIKLKSKISQMECYPDANILLTIQDSSFIVRDLSPPYVTLSNIIEKLSLRSISKICLIVKEMVSSSGQSTSICQLCLTQKKKLIIYYWNKNRFRSLREIGLDEVPKEVCWLDFNVLVMSSKFGYVAVNINDKSTNKIGIEDRAIIPTIVQFTNQSVICTSYSGCLMYNNEDRLSTVSMEFDELPITISSLYPWFVASTSVGILVFAPGHEATLLQKITVQSIHSLVACHDLIFCASSHSIHLLRQTDLQSIISSLHQNRQLKLALSLLKTTTSSISEDEQEKYKHRINQMQAYELFCKYEFKQAIEKYIESKCDPIKVIALYPNLLPESIKTIKANQPELLGVHLIDAYRSLVPFLTHHRNVLLQAEIRDVKQLQIIDTVLLKTYLHSSPSMISSLLRLKENFCLHSECQKILTEANKTSELVLLLKKAGNHQEALDILVKTNSDNSIDMISDYLSDLTNIAVILEFGAKIIKSMPDIAIRIFTNDGEAEKWPKEQIYQLFKKAKAPTDMIIQLLENYVNEWNDKTPTTLVWLVEEYRINIIELRNFMLDQVNHDTNNHHVSPSRDTLQAVDDLNVARKKLLGVLENSENLNADFVLDQFQTGDWIEERSILLSRLGRHKQALYVYTGDLPERALIYCQKMFNVCPEIYEYLLEYYIENDHHEKVIDLLKNQNVNLPINKTLSIIPDCIPLSIVSYFLEESIKRTATKRRRMQMKFALLELESSRLLADKIGVENRRIELNYNSRCSHCGRTVNPTAAIAIIPSGEIYHYGCLT